MRLNSIITLIAGAIIALLIAYGLGCHEGKTIIKNQIVRDTLYTNVYDTVFVRGNTIYKTVVKTEIKDSIKLISTPVMVDNTIYKTIVKDSFIYIAVKTNLYTDTIIKPDYTLSYRVQTTGDMDFFDYKLKLNKSEIQTTFTPDVVNKSSNKKKFFTNLLLGYDLTTKPQVGIQIGYGNLNIGYMRGFNNTQNILVGYRLF
jgi:hypothetical protein